LSAAVGARPRGVGCRCPRHRRYRAGRRLIRHAQPSRRRRKGLGILDLAAQLPHGRGRDPGWHRDGRGGTRPNRRWQFENGADRPGRCVPVGQRRAERREASRCSPGAVAPESRCAPRPWPECPPKSAMTNMRRGTPASGLGPCLFDFPKRKSISIPARFSSPMVYLGVQVSWLAPQSWEALAAAHRAAALMPQPIRQTRSRSRHLSPWSHPGDRPAFHHAGEQLLTDSGQQGVGQDRVDHARAALPNSVQRLTINLTTSSS